MVEILIELHLAHARAPLSLSPVPALRDSILSTYALDEQQYQAIMDYYAEHPEAYAAIYSTVLDRISAERLQQGEGVEDPITIPMPQRDPETSSE